MIKNRKVQESVPPFPLIPVDAKAPSKQSSKLLSLVWALSGDKTIMFETGLFHLICGQGLTGEPLRGRGAQWDCKTDCKRQKTAEVVYGGYSLLPDMSVKLSLFIWLSPVFIFLRIGLRISSKDTESETFHVKLQVPLSLTKLKKPKPHPLSGKD